MTRESSDAIRQKFREWLKLDKKARKKLGVVDQKNFAIHHGISTGRLSQWKAEEAAMSEDVFNPQIYVKENLQAILVKLLKVIQDKGTAKHIEMALKLVDLLIDKKEETLKVEFNPTERIRIAEGLVRELRREWTDSGVCPVCGFREKVHVPSYLVEGREQQQESTMAAVGLSA